MKSYLKNRRQQVCIDGKLSNELHISDINVVQGSVLSCLLYILYILDLPVVLQTKMKKPEEDLESEDPNIATFVDDTTITQVINNKQDPQIQLDNTMDKLQSYMISNKLIMNRDKTQLMMLTQNNELKENIHLKDNDKIIKPVKTIKYLGIEITENLKWNLFISDSKKTLTNQLNTRLRAITELKTIMNEKSLKKIASGIFNSKIYYGSELWGGAPIFLKNKIQKIQNKAARTVLGHRSQKWSNLKVLKEIGWMSVENILRTSSNKITHSILHQHIPETLAVIMHKHRTTANTRLSGLDKLFTCPHSMPTKLYNKQQYKIRAYSYYQLLPEQLQKIHDKTKLKKWLIKYLKYPLIKLPITPPTPNPPPPQHNLSPLKQQHT